MRLITSALLILGLGAWAPVSAQEGFPLDGTWRGEWGMPDGEKTMVVMVMEWDGDGINGLLNPGRNTVQFDDASLDPADWSVHIEATSKEGETIVVDGTLENLGSYNRTITGTWTQDGRQYPFRMARE